MKSFTHVDSCQNLHSIISIWIKKKLYKDQEAENQKGESRVGQNSLNIRVFLLLFKSSYEQATQRNTHAKFRYTVVMQSMDEAGNIRWSSLTSGSQKATFSLSDPSNWEHFTVSENHKDQHMRYITILAKIAQDKISKQATMVTQKSFWKLCRCPFFRMEAANRESGVGGNVETQQHMAR